MNALPIVVDTSFLIDVDRGQKGAMTAWRSIVESGESLFLPVPVFVEFVAGTRNPEIAANHLRGAAHLLIMGEAEAVAAAAIARRALKDGKFPGWMDILIAACAKERGDLEIITANPEHFPYSRVRGY